MWRVWIGVIFAVDVIITVARVGCGTEKWFDATPGRLCRFVAFLRQRIEYQLLCRIADDWATLRKQPITSPS